jgi:hypothetical protein
LYDFSQAFLQVRMPPGVLHLKNFPCCSILKLYTGVLIAIWINKFNPNEVKDEVVPINAVKANGGMKVYFTYS